MRTMCFDTESSYCRDGLLPPVSIERQRRWVHERGFKFDCGAVYDAKQGRAKEFTDPLEFLAVLRRADRLVSHSGKWVELPILEVACGIDAVADLWSKPHCDLFQVFGLQSVDALAKEFVPDLFTSVDDEYLNRIRTAKLRWPDIGLTKDERRQEDKCAKAIRDVKLEYAVFKKVPIRARRWHDLISVPS